MGDREVTDEVIPLLESCKKTGIPVVAVLSDPTLQRHDALQIGCCDYLGHPLIAVEVHARLSRIFQGNAQTLPLLDRYSSMAKDVRLVHDTCAYLYDTLSHPHTLNVLARHMGSNRNTLARSFKSVLGKSVFAWLREQRMITAANFLMETDLPVHVISLEVGYGDFGNFSTAFKYKYSLSPKSFRKLMRESKL